MRIPISLKTPNPSEVKRRMLLRIPPSLEGFGIIGNAYRFGLSTSVQVHYTAKSSLESCALAFLTFTSPLALCTQRWAVWFRSGG